MCHSITTAWLQLLRYAGCTVSRCCTAYQEGDKFTGLATRFTLPVHHICLNTSGSSLAAAGDEPEIKVISMSDRSAKVLRGHSAGIRGLTYDPEGEMLASASSDGTIKIWKLEDDSCVKTLAILESRADALFKMDWHPNGKFIAIPIGNQIHVYERDSWDLSFSFSGEDGHSKNVAMAVWSPNGEYLASVSTHGEIIVWETQSKQTLGRFKYGAFDPPYAQGCDLS